jgi:hypothetical protein
MQREDTVILNASQMATFAGIPPGDDSARAAFLSTSFPGMGIVATVVAILHLPSHWVVVAVHSDATVVSYNSFMMTEYRKLTKVAGVHFATHVATALFTATSSSNWDWPISDSTCCRYSEGGSLSQIALN